MTDVFLAMRKIRHEGDTILGVFAIARGAVNCLVRDIPIHWGEVPDVPDDPEKFSHRYEDVEWTVERWAVAP